MSGDVVIQMSAQDAEMVAAWQRMRQGPQAAEAELQKLARTGKRAGEEIEDAFETAGKSLGSAVMQAVGFGSAMQAAATVARLVRAEYDAILQRQQQIASSQIAVNDAWRGAAMQLSGIETSVTPDVLYEQITRGARGVDPASLFRTFQNAMPAAGTLKPEDVLAMTLESTRLAPQWKEQERVAMVSGALQVQQAFGVTPQEAFAGAVQLSAADRTVDAEALGTNILPTIAALSALGGGKDDFRYIAAKVSAFGQRAGDPQGRRTGTNIINLVRQVKEELVSAGLVDKDASLEESFNALEANPAIQQRMLGVFASSELNTNAAALQRQIMERRKSGGEFSTEARTFVAAMETLQPGSPGNKTTEQFVAAMDKLLGLTPAAIEAVERQSRALSESQYSTSTELERVRLQGKTEAELLDVSQGTRGAALKTLSDSLERMGVGPVGRQLAEAEVMIRELGGGGPAATVGRVSEMRRRFATATIEGAEAGGVRVPGAVEEARRVLAEDKLDLIAEILRRIEANPTKVTIEGDNRPNVAPQRAPVGGINDGGG